MTRLRLRRQALDWSDVDGEVVALDGRDASYLAVNAAAALLWRELAQGASRDELTALLAASYGLEEERAAADTDAFLAELEAAGLLELPEPAPAPG